MYYNKKNRNSNYKSYTYNLNDFSKGVNLEVDENALGMNYASMMYNVSYKDKTLKKGYGVKSLMLPDASNEGQWLTYNAPIISAKPKKIWNVHINADDSEQESNILLVYCDDGYIYKTFIENFTPSYTRISAKFTSTPIVLNYKYNGKFVVVICSPTDKMYLWNLSSKPVECSKNFHFTSLCSHYERVFATTSSNPREIRFSKNFDVTNWEENDNAGGFIELVDERGDINKVMSFNDYVYLIRDFGISRLSAYGDQSEFSVTHITKSSNYIYPNTATLCGDRIVYLTSDGLHYCIGGNIHKYNLKISSMIDKNSIKFATSCYYNGKYYLAVRLNFDDGKSVGCENEPDYKNNAIVEFDLQTRGISIMRGIDVCDMQGLVCKDWQKLALIFNGSNSQKMGELTNDGKAFDVILNKSWQSPVSDLGTLSTKTVRNISLITPYNIKVVVKSEQEKQVLNFSGSKQIQTAVCDVKGTRIGIEINSNDENIYVSNVEILLDVVC